MSDTTAEVQKGARAPSVLVNPVSWLGVGLALFGLGAAVFLGVLDVTAKRSNTYMGILAYVGFPALMFLGVAVAAFGAARERKRRQTAVVKAPVYPHVDLGNPKHRGFIAGASVMATLFIPLSAVGAYRAYELSESVAFCGTTCHTSMNPEYVTYQSSPHARVACVDCHVGPGAQSYMNAKLSGIRRLNATIFDSFHRPIPPAAHSLRAANETCGTCHWNEKFFGSVLKTFTHYGYDETNTPRQIDLLLTVGGGNAKNGTASGIHWHMNLSNVIEYVSTDPLHQDIPWVRQVDASGKETIFVNKDAAAVPAGGAALPRRRMDCLDCHNRVGHAFESPDRAVNTALLTKKLDASLPFVKQQAVAVLGATYATADEARKKIAATIEGFYKTKYPEVFVSKQGSIRAAIDQLNELYAKNVFPEMKASWEAYPENVGHYYSAGCFRCHDGNHVAADGRVIRKDCDLCHTTARQEKGIAHLLGAGVAGQAFVHPIDMGDLRESTCTDCHSGRGIPQ